MRKLCGGLIATTMVFFSTAAWAVTGDCDGNGIVDSADADVLTANLNSEVGDSSLASCDYDGDGGLGLDDLGAHFNATK
jgi:hypothetical protein